MPIQADYVGLRLETNRLDHVHVSLENTDGSDQIEVVENPSS
jgi:pyrimidine operon attenuation protein/uracil phosphoribosyltransferase